MFKIIFTTLMFVSLGIFSQNVNKSVCGKVTDAATGKNMSVVNLSIYRHDTLVTAAASNDKGEYCLNKLNAGTYKIVVSCSGYQKFENKTLVIGSSEKTTYNIALKALTKVANGQLKIKETKDVEKNVADREIKTLEKQVLIEKKIEYKTMNEISCKKVSNASVNAPVAVFTSQRQPEFNAEEYKRINDNEFKDVSKDPLSTMSIDVDRASYSNIRRFITKGSVPPPDAVRVEEMINYFSYNYPQPKNNVPFSITTEYTECAWNKKHNLIHIGIQGKEVKTENLPANNLVFLVDVSGSMMTADKLPLVKSGLRLLVDQLRAQDRVSLVVYAGAAGLVLPSTPGSDKEKIMQAIDGLEAGGSTAGGAGIVLAYQAAKDNFIKGGNNRVILATDGDFNVGVSSDGDLTRLIEQKREEDVFLTVLGFGTGNYKDSKMEQLADKGNGNYAYVDDILEAKKVLVKEMGGTLLTIAKDVKIQIEFNPSKVKGYRLVGYENRLLNKEDFNDDKKDAGELGAGHTVTAIYEIIPAGSDEVLASIDPLKYQSPVAPNRSSTNEIMTIKFRYKEPTESVSKLITEVLKDEKIPFSKASENCKFSSAVAEFGMILRDSKFKGEADYKSVITLAKQSKGADDEGYRAEFIRLVEMGELLKKP
jgi:Ca-activated chloride channel homolog